MLGFGTAAASASMGAVVAGGGTGVIAAMLALLKLAGNCVGGGGNSMEVLGKGAIGGGVVITLAGCDAEVVEVTSSVAVDILAAIFACNSVIFACEPDDAARALIAAALAAAIWRGWGDVVKADGGGIVPIELELDTVDVAVVSFDELPPATCKYIIVQEID